MNQSESSTNCFRKISHLGGKGYFAGVSTSNTSSSSPVKIEKESFTVSIYSISVNNNGFKLNSILNSNTYRELVI